MKKVVLSLAVVFAACMVSCNGNKEAENTEATTPETENVEAPAENTEAEAPAEEKTEAPAENTEAPAEAPAETPAETPAK